MIKLHLLQSLIIGFHSFPFIWPHCAVGGEITICDCVGKKKHQDLVNCWLYFSVACFLYSQKTNIIAPENRPTCPPRTNIIFQPLDYSWVKWPLVSGNCTPPKFNIALKSYLPNRKVVLQSPFFRGYVKPRGGCSWMERSHQLQPLKLFGFTL